MWWIYDALSMGSGHSLIPILSRSSSNCWMCFRSAHAWGICHRTLGNQQLSNQWNILVGISLSSKWNKRHVLTRFVSNWSSNVTHTHTTITFVVQENSYLFVKPLALIIIRCSSLQWNKPTLIYLECVSTRLNIYLITCDVCADRK